MPDPHPTASAARTDARVSDPDATAPGTARPTNTEFNLGAPATRGELGVFGPYRVLKELGRGGMGAVYLAVDTRLDRELALKVMLPAFATDPASKERFLREAKAVAKVSHDHVVTIFEADERDGVPYIAMQFLQGYPLDEFLKKKGSPAVAHCVRIVREAALGLAAAHARGLVHRDIKPANLWLEAPNGRVKVLDFGLAKPIGSDSELTKSGAIVGSPAYMSPEQARAQKVDHRSDLFSLGAVLYRLLTGRNPFLGDHIMAVLTALAADEPTPVRELNPNVPEPLADLVNQLLAKKPEARPQTAAEVAERLRTVLAQPTADVSASVPVVVQPLPVPPPLQVTLAPESAFANLSDEGDEATEAEAEPGRAERGKGLLWAVGGTVLLGAVVAAAVGSQWGKRGEPTAELKPREPAPPAPVPRGTGKPPKSAADRQTAEWVLSVGGKVTVKSLGELFVAAAKDLPAEPFTVSQIDLASAGPRIADADLARLNGLTGLTSLHLVGAKVSDAGLADLADLSELTFLYLNGTGTTDAGLRHLKRLRALRVLFLPNTQVTDAGLIELAGLTELNSVNVKGTKVTAAGVARLAQALPACRIEWDGGTIEPAVKAAPAFVPVSPIFTGHDLKGWAVVGAPSWSAAEGVLTGHTDGAPSALVSAADFGDFDLRLQFKLAPGAASGVFLRAWPSGNADGREFAEVVLADEAGPAPPAGRTVLRARAGEWHELKVQVVGTETDVWLNGTRTAVALPHETRGAARVGFRAGPKPVEFRNLEARTAVTAQRAGANRAAAAAVIRKGGWVGVNAAIPGGYKRVDRIDDLPAQPFSLHGVNWDGCAAVSDDDLRALAGTDVRILHLSGTSVEGRGLAHLKGCRQLMYFYGRAGAVWTDADYAALRDAPLRIATLTGTRLGDPTLAWLASRDGLADLNIAGSKLVTAAGLRALESATGLRRLYLKEIALAQGDIDRLARALPACKIEWDGGTIEPGKK